MAHSLSPALHAAAYRELGLDGWSYQAIECDEAGLAGLLGSLGPDWAGLSLTMPLKRAVLPLLDQADPVVTQTGAANTVVFSDAGAVGYNTDVSGLLAALQAAGISPAGPVLVLGGGATACSALAALRHAGVTDVTVAVRDRQTAGRLIEVAGGLGTRIRLVPFGPGADVQQSWQLLLSTVPASAADAYATAIAAGQLDVGAVFDVVYDPWPTALAAAADRAGRPTVGGFELLLQQAAEQVQLMTGLPAPIQAMRSAGLAAAQARSLHES